MRKYNGASADPSHSKTRSTAPSLWNKTIDAAPLMRWNDSDFVACRCGRTVHFEMVHDDHFVHASFWIRVRAQPAPLARRTPSLLDEPTDEPRRNRENDIARIEDIRFRTNDSARDCLRHSLGHLSSASTNLNVATRPIELRLPMILTFCAPITFAMKGTISAGMPIATHREVSARTASPGSDPVDHRCGERRCRKALVAMQIRCSEFTSRD